MSRQKVHAQRSVGIISSLSHAEKSTSTAPSSFRSIFPALRSAAAPNLALPSVPSWRSADVCLVHLDKVYGKPYC